MDSAPARTPLHRATPIGDWLALAYRLAAIRATVLELHRASSSPVERRDAATAAQWTDDAIDALQGLLDSQHPTSASEDFPLLRTVVGSPIRWPLRDVLPDGHAPSAAERRRDLEAVHRELTRIDRWLESVPGDSGPARARLGRARDAVADALEKGP